jgi:carbamoyltransferase
MAISLGISAFYHDSAVALVEDGKILFAAQEERYSRIKHDSSFPSLSIKEGLQFTNLNPFQIDQVVFYEKPILKFDRILETYLSFSPTGFKSFQESLPMWVKEKLFQKMTIINELNLISSKVDWASKLKFSDHHLSHAASAFFPSPFERAAIITADGVGEWATTSWGVGNNNDLKLNEIIRFPHSIGLLYSAFTYFCGFRVNSGEYKLMGLAPYGVPKYVNLIKDNLVNINENGSIQLNLKYFDFCTKLRMTSRNFDKLFGGPKRDPESPVNQREMDLAASIQSVTEEIVLKIANYVSKKSGEKNLVLAGGVALNCVANGALTRSNIFERIWIQPAAGDAGGALGAALAYQHLHMGVSRLVTGNEDSMQGTYLGNSYTETEIRKQLDECGAVYDIKNEEQVIHQIAQAISDNQAIGWFQGRMEFGPRALGNRSILGNPISRETQKELNLKIKFRESFRPFAPSVLADKKQDWFELAENSPYMLLVAKVVDDKLIVNQDVQITGIDLLDSERSLIPAVTHVDNSARIQTVSRTVNRKYYDLIARFYEITGTPIVVNTSFNVRGEPIVNSPKDSFRCFMGTNLDVLVIENFILLKRSQTQLLDSNHKDRYTLD